MNLFMIEGDTSMLSDSIGFNCLIDGWGTNSSLYTYNSRDLSCRYDTYISKLEMKFAYPDVVLLLHYEVLYSFILLFRGVYDDKVLWSRLADHDLE